MLYLVFSSILLASNPYLDFATNMSEGQSSMDKGDWGSASKSYRKALSYNLYNDWGSQYIYWQIYVAESNLKNIDESLAALTGFVVFGEAVLNDPRYKNEVKEFDLAEKLKASKVFIAAVWASRNEYSCREEMFSCPIYEKQHIQIYKEYLPFCEKTNSNYFSIITNENKKTLKVNAHCKTKHGKVIKQYYFKVKNE